MAEKTKKKKFDKKTGLSDKQKRRLERSDIGKSEISQAEMIQELTPEEREEYYENVDKFPDAPFGRWANGKPKGDLQQRMDVVAARETVGDAVTDRGTGFDRVVTHRRHVLEDDPDLKKSSGGYVKKYAYGGRVAKSAAEKS